MLNIFNFIDLKRGVESGLTKHYFIDQT
jgi:hypothetical protein